MAQVPSNLIPVRITQLMTDPAPSREGIMMYARNGQNYNVRVGDLLNVMGTVTSVDASGGTTGLTFTGGPVTEAGTLTLGGTLGVENGGTGATSAGGAPFALKGANADITSLSGLTTALSIGQGGTGAQTAAGAPFALKGANSDITEMSGVTGGISTPDFIQLDTAPPAQALTVGKLWWDASGTLNIGMGNGNITQQVGEEFFAYGKASAAITEGQLIYVTGAIGASGVVTFAPTIAGLTDPNAILGVATENIAHNGFGRVTIMGTVHGINTTGASSGETWADGDVLWYNPAGGGLMTKVKPSAPNQKTQVAIVINAGSGGSGSLAVEIVHGSRLGDTDSNVQLSTLSNNQLLQYDSGADYWKNVNASAVTVGAATTATSATTATNLAGGAASQIPYQTGAGATGFISNGAAGQVLTSAGAGVPAWGGISGGTF